MDGNWYMESNYEVRNRQFLKLYRKHNHAIMKLDNAKNPLATSAVGGACTAIAVAAGGKVLNFDLSPWTIAAGFFAGEYIALIPFTKNIHRLYGAEKKMMDIIEKNGTTMINKADYYVLINNVYYLNEQAYFDAYYDMIKTEDDGPVKQITKTRK